MRIAAADYEALNAFFFRASDEVFGPTLTSVPEGMRPAALLAATEAESHANARLGLAMAIGDMIEMSEGMAPERVAALDAVLQAEDIITFTEVRARFWTRVRRVMKRGTIRNERDYYAVRNVVEALPDEEQTHAWQLLDSFEQRVVSKAQ